MRINNTPQRVVPYKEQAVKDKGLAFGVREGEIGRGRWTFSLLGLRQGGFLLIATFVTGILNYLANAAMGRMLGPADYGVYAALLSMFLTLTTVTSVPQIVLTDGVARLTAEHDEAMLRGLASTALRWLAMGGVIAGLIVGSCAEPLGRALSIPQLQAVWALAAVLPPLALSPLGIGLLRGSQMFVHLGGSQITGGLMRLVGGVVFVWLGAEVTGAVASLAFIPLTSIVIAGMFLPDLWRGRRERAMPRLEVEGGFLLWTTVGAIGYALLTGLDVLIVKSRFLPVDSGLYAAISTVGRIALWIPAALTTMLLPKVAGRRANGQSTLTLLRTTQLAALILCASVSVLFFLKGPWLMRLLFGAQYVEMAQLLGLYGVAMTLYALVGIWFNYYLAIREMAYLVVLTVGCVVQAVLLSAVGLEPDDIVREMIACGVVLCIAGEVLFHRTQRRA